MEITVMLEPLDSRGYRATSFQAAHLVVEGRTREEALSRLSSLVHSQFSQGKLVRLTIPLPKEDRPRRSLAGIWKDHPDIDEVVQNIVDYRQQTNADPDRL